MNERKWFLLTGVCAECTICTFYYLAMIKWDISYSIHLSTIMYVQGKHNEEEAMGPYAHTEYNSSLKQYMYM